jgi:hypothetical protein
MFSDNNKYEFSVKRSLQSLRLSLVKLERSPDTASRPFLRLDRYSTMASTSNSACRRSQRLLRSLPVVVCGESSKRKSFREEVLTVAFNAHGALLILNARVEVGQELHLTNPITRDEQEARVVYSTPSVGGLTHVGIEFIGPAPEFWPINDAPDDWDIRPIAARRSLG